MIRRLRSDSGFTLMELLISASLMTIILGATLSVLEAMHRESADAQVRVDSRDQARTTLDRLIKPMRAAVSTTAGMVEAAAPYDLVYQSVGPASPAAGAVNAAGLQRVRYCLDTTTGKLYRSTLTFTGAAPPINPAACGQAGVGVGAYTSVDLLGANVSNGAARPLFTYDFRNGSTALKDLVGVKASLFVDANGSRAPDEARLSTSISLRNVNQAPTASFTATATAGHVLLNGAASVDPEGGSLTYAWYVDGAANPSGTDIRLDQGGLAPRSRHDFTLTVTDPEGLTDTAPTQSVTLP
jgi:prepilin-type N-terminal cleavage/methylation domain-containing protein